MKLAHKVSLRVFVKPEEDEQTIKNTFLNLLPFDIEDEKIELIRQTATGFEEKTIIVYSIVLTKDRHIRYFINNLTANLSNEQKSLLLRQAESRLDNNNNFYIRLDKQKLNKRIFYITDKGNCFHIKISLACFPNTKEAALKILRQLLEKKD